MSANIGNLDNKSVVGDDTVQQTTAKVVEAAQAQHSSEAIEVGRFEDRLSEPLLTFYSVKWIDFDGTRRPIIMQNANGCCPLLALANVLLLRGRLSLNEGTELVEAAQLLNDLTAYLFESCCDDTTMSEAHRLNWQQNAQDVLDCAFPKLQTGLDMNVRFVTPDEFECTSELLAFDMLNVRVYHGWLVDPQDVTTFAAVYGKSYNQLIDFIVTYSHEDVVVPPRSRPTSMSHFSRPIDAAVEGAIVPVASGRSSVSEKWMEVDAFGNEPHTHCAAPSAKRCETDENYLKALAASEFLDTSATQLTVYGLAQLHELVKEEELCVFFRNNHFATLTKRNSILYLLVTDAGYLPESNIVWETLDNVEGNSTYVDAAFQPCASLSHVHLHLHLHEDMSAGVQHSQRAGAGTAELDADFQVAIELQREEDALAAAALQNRERELATSHSQNNKVAEQPRVQSQAQSQSAVSPSTVTVAPATDSRSSSDRKSQRGAKRDRGASERSLTADASRSAPDGSSQRNSSSGARLRSGQNGDGCTLL